MKFPTKSNNHRKTMSSQDVTITQFKFPNFKKIVLSYQKNYSELIKR